MWTTEDELGISSEAEAPSQFERGLSRRELLARGALGGAALGLSGLVPALARASVGGGYASLIRVGYGGHLGAVDPFNFNTAAGYLAYQAWAPDLADFDYDEAAYVPGLALKWTQSADGLTYTFYLRQARWSDGKPITARDVAFTFSAGLGLQAGMYMFVGGNVASVTAVGPRTVRVKLKAPDTTMPQVFSYMPVVPEHAWKNLASDKATLAAAATRLPPVGGGPYVPAKIVPDQAALFTANPHYYLGKPKTAQFGIQVYGSDAETLLALEKGQIDVIPLYSSPLQPSSLPASVRYHGSPASRAIILHVNVSSSERHAELLNPNVREAISLGINRSQIVQNAYFGLGLAQSSMVFAGPWKNKKLRPDPYNPTRANQLLDGLGFARGSGGTRVASGSPMSYEVLMVSADVPQQVFDTIAANLQAIGIALTQRVVDAAGLFAALQNKNYALALRLNPMDQVGIGNLEQGRSTSSSNYTGWASPAFDAAYAAMNAATSPAAKKAQADRAQAVWAQAHVMIPVVSPEAITLFRKNVTGLKFSFGGAPAGEWKAGYVSLQVAK